MVGTTEAGVSVFLLGAGLAATSFMPSVLRNEVLPLGNEHTALAGGLGLMAVGAGIAVSEAGAGAKPAARK